MADPETQEKRNIPYVFMESAETEMPKYGDKLPAKVVNLGMCKAVEIYGQEKAKNPDQPILTIFFENTEENVHGKTSVPYYKHPSAKAKLAAFVREYGQPKIGMPVLIIRDDKGYWGIKGV